MAAFSDECPVIEICGGLLDRALRSPQRGEKSILDDLGRSWRPLGISWKHRESILKAIGAVLGRLWAALGRPGSVLGAGLGRPGTCWGVLEASRKHLGIFWGHL